MSLPTTEQPQHVPVHQPVDSGPPTRSKVTGGLAALACAACCAIPLLIAAGVLTLGLYGFVATFQPDPHFGRILAAYGGVFVAGSLAWGMIVDKFRPDRWDIIGAVICLAGVAVIMYAPRTPCAPWS